MLSFQNLRAAYDGREVLHGISAALLPGRLTAIIGPNGCGKSTLLKCAAGILQPSEGNIFLLERDLASIPRREQAKFIAYMPQSRITPEITVKQLASHGRYPHLPWGHRMGGEDRRIVQDALARTGMLNCADRMVGKLSGGERQRAYIAMMLAQQSGTMLLDEPASYLDLSAQFFLMDLLRDLCRENRAVGVVMHDLALALEYADDILLMNEGNLVFAGSPEELYASGLLPQVFGVAVARTEDGKYLFSKSVGEAHV